MAVPRQVTLGNWDHVGRPGAACDGCEETFAESTDFYSLLFMKSDGLSRKEVCPDCYSKIAHTAFAFWKSTVQPPDSSRPRPLDVNFLIEFFQRLSAKKDDERQLQICYIVALILIRKKTLIQLPSTHDDNGEVLRVRFKQDAEENIHEIPVPELTAEKMEIIRDDLGRIFNLQGSNETPASNQNNSTPPASTES